MYQHVRTLHLVQAIEDATELLAMGIARVATPGWQARAGQPALQTIAAGVEKLAKLTLGMMDEAGTGAFPNQMTMRRWGHDIDGLTRSLGNRLEQQAARDGSPYILRLKHALDVDPFWPGLLEALDTAADAGAGRYVHESALGGVPPVGRPIHEMWQVLDGKAIARLGLAAAITGPESRDALCRVRTEIIGTVVRWWHLLFRVWQHGLAGATARQLSTEVRLQWDTLPPSLEALANRL